jgi:cysteine-rich repeat protein
MRLLSVAVALGTALAAAAAPPPIPGLTATAIPGSATDLPVPDASNGAPGTLIDVVTTDVGGVVVDADVEIDLEHLEPAHLDVFLVAPSGRTITLTTDNGGSFDDVFRGTLFDDQAPGDPAANVRNFPYANGVATGPAEPEGALGALRGEAAAGPWALVVNDDTGGTTGILHAWTLTLYTIPALAAAAPVTVTGAGGAIPDNAPAGRTSTVTVSGAGTRLLDVVATVYVRHPRTRDLDLFLTAPSGHRIDLVTNVGGTAADLYDGTTFDDHAPTPVSDTPVPASGPFARVVAEGALSAFVGEDPDGDWTLTVVDRQSGSTGTLDGWSLTLTTGTACGDGAVDPGETCDDGNAVDGDGCDTSCTPTACGNGVVTAGEDCDDGNVANGDACPATCRTVETDCGDCVDDDGNGLVDSVDPACGATALEVRRASAVATVRGRLRMAGAMALPGGAAGAVGLVVADGSGPVLCAPLGQLTAGRRPRALKTRVGGGRLALKLVPHGNGAFTVAARGVDLRTLDASPLVVGVRVGDAHFTGTAVLRARGGGRWVSP